MFNLLVRICNLKCANWMYEFVNWNVYFQTTWDTALLICESKRADGPMNVIKTEIAQTIRNVATNIRDVERNAWNLYVGIFQNRKTE